MSAQPELWRVSTVEGVFETDLETLKQWIAEGCVLPTDKVSKGNLNWIDAGRVPKLKGAFSGEVVATPPQTTTTSVPSPDTATQQVQSFGSSSTTDPVTTYSGVSRVGSPANVCHNHPGTVPHYLCRMCSAALCKDCPRFVGSSKVPVCPLCGDLCRDYAAVTSKSARVEFQESGFGLDDFTRAVRYPFQHKVALVAGALIYSVLLLAGLRGGLLAWMILFGCISHVITQVAWGRLNRSFMPDFSAFSFWDDLVVPIFLGLGISIVSWGPVIALTLALMFGVISTGVVSPLSPEGQLASAQSAGPTEEDLDVLLDPNGDPKKAGEASKKLDQLRPGAQLAREAERSQEEENDPLGFARMLVPYFGAGLFVIVLFLASIAWAIFYYPMALAVAGYTQSFGSVINPLVGLDTIRRMGSTYFKAFGMVIAIQIVATILSAIVALLTSPFTLPFIGNLPAHFINGTITFYFYLVIACVLGLSLFKCADRLGIEMD